MPLDADIYGYKQPLTPSLGVSAALHAALAASLFLIPHLMSSSGLEWGNNGNGAAIGGAMSATLVSGIPLPPKPNANPQNVLATENPGLSKPLPAPPTKEKEDETAIALPGRESRVKPKPEKQKAPAANPQGLHTAQAPAVVTPSKPLPNQIAKADNTIPFGEGGPVAGPYTSVQIGNSAGGMKFGEGGNGTFGNLFGWYTTIVANKVHQAWESEVNPNITAANRVYITFDIARNGSPSNIRIEHSSGIPSLDQSALNALQRIDTFGPLPQGYSGRYVSVEFWFDYRR
ncbi:MAG: TonB family protein [Candidatus Korobacteraceae bacterium]